MNIKQFLVIKICDDFPSDVCSIIWSHVKALSANEIRKLFYLKVSINMDFFLILLKLSNGNRKNYNYNHVNKIIKLYKNKIAFRYIQEPGSWIEYLQDIKHTYAEYKYFNINDINEIINKVCINNEIYNNFNVSWWEYL